jgi:hypothetical protein
VNHIIKTRHKNQPRSDTHIVLIGFGYTDQVDVPESDKMPHLGIVVAGLFTYELQNLDEQDWKNLDDNNSPSEEDIFNGFDGQNGRMFGNGELRDSPGFSQPPVDQFTSNLPYGPPNDPLQSLSLTAFFPSAPHNTYLDNDVYSEMDAVRAPIWILRCNFYPENQMHGLLSSMLNNAISSLNMDGANELAEKSNDSKGKFRNKDLKKSQVADIPGAFKSDDSTYDTGRFTRMTAGEIVDMDDAYIDDILHDLFHPLSNKILQNNFEQINTLSGIPLLSASSLGRYFRDVRTVPYKSFLWNLLEYLLETVSPMSSSRDSFLGFLKILWNLILREIRLNYWERLEPIPDVNIYMSENENVTSIVNQNGSLPIDDNKMNDSIDEKINSNNIGIDMRFNIIHQKLCMINCCIARMRQDQKNNPTLSTSPKYLVSSNNSLGSSDSMSINKINKISPLDQKQTTMDPFDEITMPEASVILVNSNGTSNSEINNLVEKEIKFSNVRK